MYGCLKCGYQWEGRKKLKSLGSIPKACPECKCRGNVYDNSKGMIVIPLKSLKLGVKYLQIAKEIQISNPEMFKSINDVLAKSLCTGLGETLKEITT